MGMPSISWEEASIKNNSQRPYNRFSLTSSLFLNSSRQASRPLAFIFTTKQASTEDSRGTSLWSTEASTRSTSIFNCRTYKHDLDLCSKVGYGTVLRPRITCRPHKPILARPILVIRYIIRIWLQHILYICDAQFLASLCIVFTYLSGSKTCWTCGSSPRKYAMAN